MKRKELLNNYENLKRSHESLEESLIQALRKSSECTPINQEIRLDKMPSRND